MAKTAKKPTAEGVISDLQERLEELRDAALEEISQAVARAEQTERRYWQSREQLAESREHLRSLHEEYERLPGESHRQRMRGEAEAEEKLNQRYRDVEAEIPRAEERVKSLAAECDELVHGSARALPSAGAAISSHGPALRVAQPHRDAFDKLAEEIPGLLDDVRKPVDREHGDLQALIRTQGNQVSKAYREAGYQNAQDVPSH